MRRLQAIVAALVLVLLGGSTTRPVTCQTGDACASQTTGDVSVEVTGSTYTAADLSRPVSGFFGTGQNADIMLSGIDFNTTGGGLLFNHQASIATDGTRLLVADTFNNRVLIWNTAPASNVAPDLVLGQKDFTSNNPGTGRDQLNWPIQVATDGQYIAVTDTYNDRILIWNAFPAQNGVPADLVIQGPQVGSKGEFRWPWGVWTDGRRLAVSGGGKLVIWNQFPTADNAPPDLVTRAGGQIGTPRQITSNGTSLLVGDHNAKVPGKRESGTFFWRSFPTTDEALPDFFLDDAATWPWLQGTFTADGRLVVLGSTLLIWNTLPVSDRQSPDLQLAGYNFSGGDYGGVAIAGGRTYVSSGNLNKIVVYNSLPTRSDQLPDFAIASPGICTNTLETNFFITNSAIASNGTSLFVSSDFDRKLYVWRNLPDQSGAHPDLVYRLPDGPWDIGISGRTLALAGKQVVYIWDDLPTTGQLPNRTFKGSIGSVRFGDLKGVAIDDRYFYLADATNNQVYMWSGVPSASSEPAFSLAVTQPGRLSSDGNYLTVTATFEHKVFVYPVASLSSSASAVTVGGPGTFNLPQGAFAAQGRLFVADTGFNRVHVWSSIENALAGQKADIVLGETNFDDLVPEIGRNKTFWPASVFFDGRYLWVGEFKFSNRLLRFSPVDLAGSVDVNGDGKADAVRYNAATGAWTTELGTGSGTFTSGSSGTWDKNWSIYAADFNLDAYSDLFMYNGATGAWMKAFGAASGGYTTVSGTWSSSWSVYVLNLDGDRGSDIFLYDVATGARFKCIHDPTTGDFSRYYSGTWSPQWSLYPADWNGDGKGDLFLYNILTGQWFRATNDGGADFAYYSESWSAAWSVYPGDFSGDGKTDLFLYHPTSGQWFICTNTGTTFSYVTGTWASAWTVKTGDFDGDGKADVFLYNTTTGEWFECVTNAAGNFTYYTGTWDPAWQVFIADLSGDGRSDVLLYRGSTWFQALNTSLGVFSYGSGTWDANLTVVATSTKLP